MAAIEDKNELIASGQAVAIIPAGVSLRPDLTTVPLQDVEPGHVVLATRADDRSRLVAAFRKSAQAFLTCPQLGRTPRAFQVSREPPPHPLALSIG